MLIKHNALLKLNTYHQNIFLNGYTKLCYEPLWNTMNHHDLLWVTINHYDSKHIHYDSLSPTINHSESLWLNVFPLWSTMSQYGPIFDTFYIAPKRVRIFIYFFILWNIKVLHFKSNLVQKGIQECLFWIRQLSPQIISPNYLSVKDWVPPLQSSLLQMKLGTCRFLGMLTLHSTFFYIPSRRYFFG